MIDIPTLFILGAGASKPYGYPTGAELRADIINNYSKYFDRLKDVVQRDLGNALHIGRQIKKFVDIFSKSSISSIDKFLSLNPNYAACGKIAITLSILNSEKTSRFRVDMETANEDWYTFLFNKMMDGLNKPNDYENFCKNKVAFITFNYDRSLEYILYDSFFHSFHQNRKDIEFKIDNLVPFPIIHVYGTVDKIKTINWPAHNYRADFDNYLLIEELSKGIRVIGEERTGESTKDQIKKLLPSYKRIFFLGFGYAQENLEAIDFLNNVTEDMQIYGTAKGMTRKEITDIIISIPSKNKVVMKAPDGRFIPLNSSVVIENINIVDLFKKYL
jgi:hypothetical protein